MRKISKMVQGAYEFWKDRIEAKDLIARGQEFPNEYIRKILQREEMIFTIKKGLYLLKNKGEDAENIFYQLYWQIVGKIVEIYEPYSIERESALCLHLGDESIPCKLLVRTSRNVKYPIALPFNLQVQIRPDPFFHEKTRQSLEIGKSKIFLDVPERVLLTIRKRSGIRFKAFIKGVKFNRQVLEILYYSNPKPIIVKELTEIADKAGRSDLSLNLRDILKKYTIYRS